MSEIYVVTYADYNHPEFWTDKKEEVDKFIINWINEQYCNDNKQREFWLKFYEDEGYLEDVWNVYCVPRYASTSPL